MKKIISAAVAAVMSLTLLAGCSGGDKSANGKTKLLLGLPGGDGLTPWKIVENFKEANKDKYVVEEDTSAWGDFTQKIKLQFVSKNDVTPVFVTDSMQAISFGAQGAVMDLQSWVDEKIDKTLYNKALTTLTDKEGHLWGVPHGLNSIAMVINKDIFAEKGVEIPTEDWTWQEMLDLAKKLTFTRADGTKVYGINYTSNITQGWLPFMSAVGVQPYKDDFRNSNLDDPKVKDAMVKYRWAIDEGLVMPAAELSAIGGAEQAFANGQIAMALLQASSIKPINNFAPDLNYDAIMMPIGWNGERTCIYVPNSWQVYAGVSEDEKEGVLAWLEYFLSEEAQMIIANEGSSFPCMIKALDAVTNSGRKPEHIDAFYKGINEYGLTLLENPTSGTTRSVVDTMTSKIKAGDDIDARIAEAHQTMQDELDYFYESNE